MHWYLYLRNLLRTEEGQDLTEYALLLALIAIALIVAVTAFGSDLQRIFRELTGQLEAIDVPPPSSPRQ